MKKGDKVKIYQKPLTKEDYEGEARLVNFVHHYKATGEEVWEVRFNDDETLYQRLIKL